MDVGAREEGIYHHGVAAEVGHQAKLYLRVVGREHQASGVGDEGAAYVAAVGGADWDVLEVGTGGRYAARGRHGLIVGGVYLASGRIDELGKGVDVGGQELLESADVEDEAHQGHVNVLLEDVFGRGPRSALGLACLGVDAHLVEEYLPYLRRRADVELPSGYGVCLGLEVVQTGCELAREDVKLLRIDACALPLHRREDGDEGELDIAEERFLVFRGYLGLEERLELQAQHGGLRHGRVRVKGRAQTLGRSGRVVPCGELQVGHGQCRQVVLLLGLTQIVGHRGVEPPGALECDAEAAQDEHVALDVGAAYAHRRVGEEGLEQFGHSRTLVGALAEGDVADAEDVRRAVDAIGQSDAEGLRAHGLRTGGVHAYAHRPGRDGPCDEAGVGDAVVAPADLCADVSGLSRSCGSVLLLLDEVEERRSRVRLTGLHGDSRLRRGHRRVFLKERAELKLPEEGGQRLDVRLTSAQGVGVEADGSVGDYGDQMVRQTDEVGVLGHLLLEGAFEGGGVGKQILYGAELVDELDGGLLAHTGTARDVVGGIALERKEVYDLTGRLYAVLLTDLFGAAHLESQTFERRTVHEHPVRDELSVVLVGGHHVGGESGLLGAARECSDDVVGLVAGHFDDGYAVGIEKTLDVGYGHGDVLGLLVASGLILGVLVMAEGAAVGRVEAYGYISGILLAEHILEGIAETEYRRGIHPRRIDAGRAQQRVVRTVDECVGIEEKQFFIFHTVT